MSNSPLVTYTKISPNRTSPRIRAIDTITIHHMAAVNASIEACGAEFAKASRASSANYGIGSDGRVALYVDEGDRSWASSNSANDHRAVTIEVANSAGAPDWPVSDKAYAALIDLCADICRRNGIKRLVWAADKAARANHTGGANMTMHRDFVATACPGNYLAGRMADIAAQVNVRLEDKPMTVDEAKTLLKGKAKLSDETIQYLWSYRFGDDLLVKLAEAMKEAG